MSDITFYHNPRCSKSREALALLRERGVEPQVVEYLQTPPDAAELKAILGRLGLSAQDILRRKEPEYLQLGLANARMTEDGLIDVMVRHPKLIERPIAVRGGKAAIGRPPENVLALL